MNTPILVVDGVSKAFQDADRPLQALQPLPLAVQRQLRVGVHVARDLGLHAPQHHGLEVGVAQQAQPVAHGEGYRRDEQGRAAIAAATRVAPRPSTSPPIAARQLRERGLTPIRVESAVQLDRGGLQGVPVVGDSDFHILPQDRLGEPRNVFLCRTSDANERRGTSSRRSFA